MEINPFDLEVHVLSDVTYRESHPGWVGKLKGCEAPPYAPLIRDVKGDVMPGGLLNSSPVEIARARAEASARRRQRDEEFAALVASKDATFAPLLEDYRRRLAAASGLHRVLMGWHKPVRKSCWDELLCEHCDDSEDYYGDLVVWPCPTYEAVLANPT